MNHNEVVAQLMTLAVIPLDQEDADFLRILPTMFLHAEGRIYRELQFLATLPSQPFQLIANSRDFTLPASVITLDSISVCTPAGAISNSSTRNPLERVTPQFIDYAWPKPSFCPQLPQKYAMIGAMTAGPPQVLGHTVRLMPTPDKPYWSELLGRILPDTLSPTNDETFLSVRYPELFIACCMTFASGYQKDYGGQADDPQSGPSWETQYTTLRQGVMLEAAQQRGEGPGWTAATPAPGAQPRAP